MRHDWKDEELNKMWAEVDVLFENAQAKTKEYNKEYAKFRKELLKTKKYYALTMHAKWLYELTLEVKRRVRNYSRENKPERLKALKKQELELLEICRKAQEEFHKKETEKRNAV